MCTRKKRFSKEEKFSQISSLEGYLQKLSPQFLVGFQRRYFCIRDGGQKLIYYKSKPELKAKPKGMLEVKDISNMEKKNKTDFSFQYEERKFELRANDEAECDKWIFSLDFLKGFVTNLENQKAKEKIEIRFSSPSQSQKKKEKWRINNLDSQTFNEVQAEHERNIINQKKEQKEVTNSLDDFNRILDIKGIKSFIDKLDPKVVKSRLCMGFLSKKGKNNITRYQKRFFVLLSAKSLSDCLKDDIILKDEDLPPWLELETIYYFQCKSIDDSSPFIGKISLRNCLSITVEDNQHKNILENLKQDFLDFSSNLCIMKGLFSWETKLGLTKPEHGFGFKLTTKERTYYFYADLITEMNKWIIAIGQSLKNYKDLHPNFIQDDIAVNDVSPGKHFNLKNNSCEFLEGSDFPPLINMEKIENANELQNKPIVFAKEGYLFKKAINKLSKLIGWEQRYLCLKDEKLFWVKNNIQKNEPKTLLQVKNIENCDSHKENQFLLVINQKKYKFKAETQEDRDKWVQLINKARGLPENNDQQINNFPSESDVNDYNFNNENSGSIDILKITQTRQDDEEDSVFSRFYALNEDNPSINLIKTRHPRSQIKPNTILRNVCSCLSQLFCCFKNKPETEEEYYSQL